MAYCHTHLWITDQSWQTGPNEFVLHFEAVFVVCWHQIVELIQVVSCTISLFWSNYANFRHRFVFWRYWNKSSNQKKIPRVCLHDYLKRLSSKVCFDASFTSLSRFVSFRVSFNYKCCWTQRCGFFSHIRLWLTDQSWYTGPNESALLFELVFIVWWHQIRKLVRLLSKQFYDFF